MTPGPGQLRAFAYLTAEKALLYRAVLAAFVEAKARFALHLRPREIAAALSAGPSATTLDELDGALRQLCEWGNLEAHQDTADVATVEDFYRPRFLYQLTAAGEAAEFAVREFHRLLEQPGELQTVALADILALLRELAQVAETVPLDEGKVFRSLKLLCARLEELTSRAQAFLRGLHRTIELQGLPLEDFVTYKERLVEYLERFVGELVISGGAIGAEIERLESLGVDRLLEAAAAREIADALEQAESTHLLALEGWRARWRGLRDWFLGTDERPAQAETLRARARSAIPALLAAVANVHDRRMTRTDRSTDWRTLARWFATAEDERDAHRLWRAATGLPPARHLAVDERSLERWELDDLGAKDSWLEAPPLKVSLRLRATGRYTRQGRLNNVIDRAREKTELARLARLETEQIEAAQRRIALGRPMRLSEFGTLDAVEFGLLLELLGEALANKIEPGDVVEASSSDGGLVIRLEPLAAPEAEAVIEVDSFGAFRGPDHLVTIRRFDAADGEEAA